MSFDVGQYSVAEPRITGVSGRPGVGISELCFSVAWTMFPSPKSGAARIHSTEAAAFLGIQGAGQVGVLGQGWPETAWFRSTSADRREETLLYRLSLTPSQIMEIERVRAGRGLDFMLQMRGIVEFQADFIAGFTQCNFSINPYDWAEILRQLNARDILLVGVDLPPDGTGNVAATAVRKAHEHLVAGAYDAAIAECRKAIESLLKRYALEEAATKARNQLAQSPDRERQSLFQRRLALVAVVQHLTHLGAHTGDRGEIHIFSREDAAMVVAATAGAVTAIVADRNANADRGAT